MTLVGSVVVVVVLVRKDGMASHAHRWSKGGPQCGLELKIEWWEKERENEMNESN